jgi:hypothetical protein
MKIAVFYHAILSGLDRPIDRDYAAGIINEQVADLRNSGLCDACHELHVGVNGPAEEAMMVASLVPDKAQIVVNGPEARSEIPTLQHLVQWLPGHEDWAVFYHHVKSVSTMRQADNWRRRMQWHCVGGWKNCVAALERGVEAAGCHWLTPEQNPGAIASPFFGGNFWWARGKYLMTIPPLPPDTWANRYIAESWIGSGPKRPRVHDFSPGWPTP